MGRLFEGDTPTIDEIRKLRQPRTHTVGLPLDQEILARIEQLEGDLRRAEKLDASQNRDPEAPAIAAELDELRGEAEGSIVAFTFQELPRKRYRAILEAHPDPTGKAAFDAEAAAPALIAACCIEPAMTLADAEAIWDEWSAIATTILYGAALMVNEGQTKIPFGVAGTARTHASGPSSTTAPNTESVTTSS
jgi:hypothetical protein